MIDKKIIAVFTVLLCLAFYDKLVKYTTEFPVNLVVFFYVSVWSFFTFAIFEFRKQSKNKFDRKILIVAALPFILRIGLNLLAINQSRDTYNNLVSNDQIDYFTWLALIVILMIISWRKFIV